MRKLLGRNLYFEMKELKFSNYKKNLKAIRGLFPAWNTFWFRMIFIWISLAAWNTSLLCHNYFVGVWTSLLASIESIDICPIYANMS